MATAKNQKLNRDGAQAKKNYDAANLGSTSSGNVGSGHIHKKADVTAGVVLNTPDGRHQFYMDIDDGGRGLPNGFRSYPDVIVKTRTGFGYVGIPLLSSVIQPIGADPDRLIQVTDLPGLKQTGYYDGKPYYGAVFYENGIRYAGYYDTPGQKVQIYDTMIESINAQITTPPLP